MLAGTPFMPPYMSDSVASFSMTDWGGRLMPAASNAWPTVVNCWVASVPVSNFSSSELVSCSVR